MIVLFVVVMGFLCGAYTYYLGFAERYGGFSLWQEKILLLQLLYRVIELFRGFWPRRDVAKAGRVCTRVGSRRAE